MLMLVHTANATKALELEPVAVLNEHGMPIQDPTSLEIMRAALRELPLSELSKYKQAPLDPFMALTTQRAAAINVLKNDCDYGGSDVACNLALELTDVYIADVKNMTARVLAAIDDEERELQNRPLRDRDKERERQKMRKEVQRQRTKRERYTDRYGDRRGPRYATLNNHK